MQGERWRQVDKIFHDLIDQTPEERESFLEQVCANDPSLKKEVEQLIEAYERSGSFLDSASAAHGSLIGRSLGSYKVEGLLGFGGMGEVYRARDTKLDRDVAIKVLPEAFARDAGRMTRFGREAKLLAALDHPNIAAVYGLEDSGDTRALVMQLAEGPTLAERIAQGPIPIEETLPIARQIAEALEYAHERGIIHRDLKPANVKVSANGMVKLLDFGLAKAMESELSAKSISDSPTLSRINTQAGALLGTAAYMSPEQANGKTVDRRADIWAFGCVLYEMLTGTMTFHGDTVTDTLAAVIRGEPDWSLLPAETPPALRALLRRCLQKEARQRLRDIGDARIALEDLAAGKSVDVASAGAPDIAPRSRWWIPAIALLVIAVVVVGIFTLRPGTPNTNGPLQLQIVPPPGGRFEVGSALGVGMAVSPNGEMLAAVATVDGASSLWVESLRDGSARKVARSFVAQRPFWSPDSKFIGFFAGPPYGLYQVDAAGGEPVLVAALNFSELSGSWTEDGQILLMNGAANDLEIVPASGGTPKRLLAGAGFPQALPGGNFLFQNYEPPAIDAAPIAHPENRKRLVSSSGHGVYAAGYLLWRDGTALLAQKFDPSTLSLSGEPQRLRDTVAVGASNDVSLTVSTRRLIYDAETNKDLQLAWYTREEQRIAPHGPAGSYQVFRLFDNGRRVVVQANDEKDRGCWLIDDKGISTRLLSGEPCISPTPAPDGKAIIYGQPQQGLLRVDITGQNKTPLPVPDPHVWQYPTDWSGDFLLFPKAADKKDDIWSLRLAPDGSVAPGAKPELYLRTDAMENAARFAPGHNQRWLAYESDESARLEIYVQSFPIKGEKVRISPQGGRNPVWGPEGRELFYLSLDDKLMAVDMAYRPNSVSNSPPHELFRIPVSATVDTLDGKHFLVLAPVAAANRPMQVIDNWTALLH